MSPGIRTNEKKSAHAYEHEFLPFCNFLIQRNSPFITPSPNRTTPSGRKEKFTPKCIIVGG